MVKKKKRKLNKKKVFFALFLLLLIIFIPIYLIFSKDDNKELNNENKKDAEPVVKEEEKKLQIIDVDSNSRPFAVMINNNHDAWPISGLQDAYLVYEIITEGGITRMLALYKDADTAKIGSARSARHYFIDYALENDAIYAHYGWSPQAELDIYNLNVANINGLYASNAYWRDTSLDRDYEHTAFTSIEKLKSAAEYYDYRLTSDKDLLLNYSIDEININDKENAVIANNIDINYSYYHTTSYVYDGIKKVYKRSMSGVENTDLVTGEQYTVKNIIVAKVDNYSIDNYGRQELDNIGNGDGYFITNGYAVPIKWEKVSRSSQTVYSYLDGTEITVNDGNTFIQIQPLSQDLIITE